jgi:peptidoglycan/LPS O-acetylase OafA/YrhL
MNENTKKLTTSFWIISGIALFWNVLGVMAYLAEAFMSEETLQSLPEAEQAIYQDVPAWATAAFALAVWGGALGCLLLLLRKRWAKVVLVISFLGIFVQMNYNVFLSKSMEVYGPGGLIMPVLVVFVGAFLVWYSRKADTNGWLN